MNVKYQKLKVWNMWSDVHRRCLWRIMTQIGERWYSLYSELLGTDFQGVWCMCMHGGNFSPCFLKIAQTFYWMTDVLTHQVAGLINLCICKKRGYDLKKNRSLVCIRIRLMSLAIYASTCVSECSLAHAVPSTHCSTRYRIQLTFCFI